LYGDVIDLDVARSGLAIASIPPGPLHHRPRNNLVQRLLQQKRDW